MPEFLIQAVGSWFGPLVQLSVLVGAAAAAYKFRVFDVLGHKYRSEVWCGSMKTGSGSADGFLFVGNYVIQNTGSRPLKISSVQLRLLEPEVTEESPIYDSERARELICRDFGTDTGVSWFKIGAGERSIFSLRCRLDRLPAPVLLECSFRWKHRGRPSPFVWLYDPRMPVTWWSEPTPGLPDPGVASAAARPLEPPVGE
jgi:hypothetical protein